MLRPWIMIRLVIEREWVMFIEFVSGLSNFCKLFEFLLFQEHDDHDEL